MGVARATLAVLIVLIPALTVAEEPPQVYQTDPAVLQRLEAVEQRNLVLERRLAIAAEEEAKSKQKKVKLEVAPGKGFTVATPDERFSLNFKARAQVRDTITIQQSPTAPRTHTNEINVKTIRLWFTGNVFTRHLTYGVQLALGGGDFEPGSSSPLFDAFVQYSRLRDLHIKVGQYFVPFDRARTIREFALQFVDRQLLVTELSLDRDVGVTFFSDDLFGSKNRVGYAIFLGGGDGRNRFGGQSEGPIVTARLIVRPWGLFDDDQEGDLSRAPRPRLAIGIAAAYNHDTVRNRSTLGDTLVLGGFNYVHAAADVVFKHSGFAFLGEFLYRQGTQNHHEGNHPTTGARMNEWTRSGYGYLLQAGQMLHKHVELTVRWDQQFTQGATDPAYVKQVASLGKELGGGLNVYLNGHAFKLQTDYALQFGDDLRAARHLWRVQLDATF
jgi:hypothetical protein